jgi:hypothetical protein
MLVWVLAIKHLPALKGEASNWGEDGVPVQTSLELRVVESKDDSNRFLDFVEEMDSEFEVEDE